jgi:DnaJ homolog subfamily A member 2
MLVKLTVTFPDTIPSESIPLLEKALPPRRSMETYDSNVIVEEVSLDEPDTRTRREFNEDAMDEDTDEPRVQCANQ